MNDDDFKKTVLQALTSLQGSVTSLEDGQKSLQGSVTSLEDGQRELAADVASLQQDTRRLEVIQESTEEKIDQIIETVSPAFVTSNEHGFEIAALQETTRMQNIRLNALETKP